MSRDRRKAVIAADVAPVTLGSIELTFHAVGQLLEERGLDVRYWFSGGVSWRVRGMAAAILGRRTLCDVALSN